MPFPSQIRDTSESWQTRSTSPISVPPSMGELPVTKSSQIGDIPSTPPTIDDQWLRFLEKLTPSKPLWCQFVDKLSSSAPHTRAHWMEFVKKLVRPHQLIDVSVPEFDKLFVLTIHSYHMGENAVWLLDVNGPSNIHKYSPPSLDPVIRFSYLRGHHAFVILGYKLYMFGGWLFNDKEEKWMNNMSIYDMREALSSPTTIDLTTEEYDGISNIVTGPEMAVGKCCPVAVVIGQFRICVFSASLYVKHKGKFPISSEPSFLSPNFEVYDTRTDSWIRLPEPLDWDKFKPESYVHVDSYCVHLSSLLIQTNLGIFGINLDNPRPEWVKMDGSESIQKFPFKGMWKSTELVLGEIDPRSYPIALKDSTNRDSLIQRRPSGVLYLGGANKGCSIDLCSVRGGLGFCDNIPYLLVDIVKFGTEALKNLGSDCPRWKEIQSDKSFTFSLSSMPSKYMRVIGCCPVKVHVL